jgi:death-on-curing protein
LGEVLRLHTDLVATSGGAAGVRDLGRIESALAQPLATFDGADLYPTLHEKAAALGFALVQGHPFVDGNKRIGHAAMEVFRVGANVSWGAWRLAAETRHAIRRSLTHALRRTVNPTSHDFEAP